MGTPEKVRKLTEAEYLAIERAAEFKSEFFDGQVYPMAGGSSEHSRIATNLIREFGLRLKGKSCEPFNSHLRIKVETTGLLTYPDLSVVCGRQRFLDEEEDTLINPTLIAEVLSDSTEAYDRGKKFEHYRQMPTLKEYLLVSQHEPRVDQFLRRDDEEWLLRTKAGLKSRLAIPALKISIPLAEIFSGVRFQPARIRIVVPRR